MKTKLRTALLIVAALAGIVVLLFILWFRPNTDVSAELQEVFPSTESASQVTSEATTEASNAAGQTHLN